MKEQIIFFVITGLIAVFTFYKEWESATPNQRISLIILLIISISGALTSVFFGIEKEKKESENEILIKTLNRHHSDTLRLSLNKSAKIIDLQNQMLESASDLKHRQTELNDAYIKITSLQGEKIAEVLGGETPPIINIVAQTTAKRSFNKVTNNFDSADFFVDITFYLINESKYHLKSVAIKVNNSSNYGNIRKVIKKSEKSWDLILYDQHAAMMQIKDTSLATLPSNIIKTAYHTTVPIGLDGYLFGLKVEWSNGYYRSFINFAPSNLSSDPEKYLLKVENIEFFGADNKPIKVKYNFFSNNTL
jgi:hypothetical protein